MELAILRNKKEKVEESWADSKEFEEITGPTCELWNYKGKETGWIIGETISENLPVRNK